VLVLVVELIVEVVWVANHLLVLSLLMVAVVVVLVDYLVMLKQEEQVLRLRLPLVVDRVLELHFHPLHLMDLLQVVFKVDLVEYRGDQVLMMMLEEVRVVEILVKIIHFQVSLVQLQPRIEMLNPIL
jgi:hypothetical protein